MRRLGFKRNIVILLRALVDMKLIQDSGIACVYGLGRIRLLRSDDLCSERRSANFVWAILE